jgi:hypothetical protein
MPVRLTCSDRSGREVAVRVAAAGLRRLLTVLPADQVALAGVRALLIADVLARLVEDLHGGQVLTAVAAPGLAASELGRVVDAFGVRPPAVAAGSPAAAVAQLGAAAQLTIVAADSPVPRDGEPGEGVGYLLGVGGVIATANARGAWSPAAVDWLAEQIDPLAVRLALLDADRRRPVVLADPEREQAATALDRWRRTVAAWAESPSCPIPAAMSELLQAALDDDLDVSAMLVALHRIEGETDVAPGAKFETFLYADRVLGLDLARDVGKVPPGGSRRSTGAGT